MAEKVYEFKFKTYPDDLLVVNAMYVITDSVAKAVKLYKKKFPLQKILWVRDENGNQVPIQYIKKLIAKV